MSDASTREAIIARAEAAHMANRAVEMESDRQFRIGNYSRACQLLRRRDAEWRHYYRTGVYETINLV